MLRTTLVLLFLVSTVACSTGCRSTSLNQSLGPYFGSLYLASTKYAECDDDTLLMQMAVAKELYSSAGPSTQAMQVAEAAYTLAERRQLASDPAAVDYFYQTACFCEDALKQDCPLETAERATEMYSSSIAQMLVSAQRHGRLSTNALTIMAPAGPIQVPLAHHGFPWKPQDFQQWYIVGEYDQGRLVKHARKDGVGVPLVVVRNKNSPSTGEDEYFRERHAFVATALLQGDVNTWIQGEGGSPTLHLYDPLRRQEVEFVGGVHPLRSDTSASLIYGSETELWNPIEHFLFPDEDKPSNLLLLEPYQAGKIPVIFVHGLVSAPQTFLNSANEIRANRKLSEKYQIWAFEYATGGPFMTSAAELRQTLRTAIKKFGGSDADPALGKIVLVGHSLGGLVSKLLVTSSGNVMWNHVSNVPLDQLHITPRIHRRLQRAFCFSPVTQIERVVFIASPFDGSPWADCLLGRAAGRMVRFGTQENEDFQSLIQNNPGAIHPKLRGRLPTSVELLATQNPVLEAMKELPVNPGVQLHNIIGDGRRLLLAGPADGVVPITSARQPNVQSELYVDATHGSILDDRETLDEIMRILRKHISQ
jgi:pimeloyl-ACP methyl ester carboxylesterase